jgi:hypothetical protein
MLWRRFSRQASLSPSTVKLIVVRRMEGSIFRAAFAKLDRSIVGSFKLDKFRSHHASACPATTT